MQPSTSLMKTLLISFIFANILIFAIFPVVQFSMAETDHSIQNLRQGDEFRGPGYHISDQQRDPFRLATETEVEVDSDDFTEEDIRNMLNLTMVFSSASGGLANVNGKLVRPGQEIEVETNGMEIAIQIKEIDPANSGIFVVYEEMEIFIRADRQ